VQLTLRSPEGGPVTTTLRDAVSPDLRITLRGLTLSTGMARGRIARRIARRAGITKPVTPRRHQVRQTRLRLARNRRRRPDRDLAAHQVP